MLQLLQVKLHEKDCDSLENIPTSPSPLDCFVDPSETNLEIPVKLEIQVPLKYFDFLTQPFSVFPGSFFGVSLSIFLNRMLWLTYTAILIEYC